MKRECQRTCKMSLCESNVDVNTLQLVTVIALCMHVLCLSHCVSYLGSDIVIFISYLIRKKLVMSFIIYSSLVFSYLF